MSCELQGITSVQTSEINVILMTLYTCNALNIILIMMYICNALNNAQSALKICHSKQLRRGPVNNIYMYKMLEQQKRG